MTLDEINNMENQYVYYKNTRAIVDSVYFKINDGKIKNFVQLIVQQKIQVDEEDFKDIKFIGIDKEIIKEGNRTFIQYKSVPSDVRMGKEVIDINEANVLLQSSNEPLVFKMDLSQYSKNEKEQLLNMLKKDLEDD